MEQEVLTIERFLDEPLCRRIRAAMDEGLSEPAEVLEEGAVHDEEVRRATHVEIDPAVRREVEERLDALRDRLGAHFRMALGRREGVSVLRYAPGGFYRRHRDRGDTPAWPDAAKRRLALVVFLNSSRHVDPAGDFWGGALRLFPDEDGAGADVHAQAGLLVAFPAEMLHEVTTVREGTRDTIVDWFYPRLSV